MSTDPAVLPVHLTTSQVRPVAYRILSKKHGLNLKSTGLEVLAKFLGTQYGVDWRGSKAEKFLDKISKLWKEQDRGLFIDGETLTLVIREATVAEGDKKNANFDWRDYVKVINAQDQPVYKYNAVRKQYEVSDQKPSMVSRANNRSEMFTTRYNVLHDRLMRDETFQPASFGNKNSTSITNVKNMMGRNNSEFVLMGLLTKGADGAWYLQDKSDKIVLDLETRAVPAPTSYYTSGAFVICAGVYHNSTFVVDSLGPPPAERRESTRSAQGHIDFLGVHSVAGNNKKAAANGAGRVERVDKQFEQQLRAAEQQLNHKIVILGTDIFLDQLRVMDALRSVFKELEAGDTPVAIIFPGSFCSLPFQPNGSSTAYKESFDFLAQLLKEFPAIAEESTLIFIPGDNDPWAATFTAGASPSWPLEPIPSIFTNRVRRVAPKTIWASNPSKLAYLSQEIVMVRDNYGARFRRNSVVFPREYDQDEEMQQAEEVVIDGDDNKENNEDEDVQGNKRAIANLVEESAQKKKTTLTPAVEEARKVVRTILDQGHLSPFPLMMRPVYWQYDHVLQMTPLPSMLILADPSTPAFKVTYEGCYVVNPGTLLTANHKQAQWVEYDAAQGVAKEKCIYI